MPTRGVQDPAPVRPVPLDREDQAQNTELGRVAADALNSRIGTPLPEVRFRWEGRLLDFFGLLVLALMVVQSSIVFDLLAGSGRVSIAFILARSVPLLAVGVLVALLTVFCPEQVSGTKRQRRSHKSPPST